MLIDQPVYGIQPWRLADGRQQFLVGLTPAARPACTFREERRALPRHESPQPELGTGLRRIRQASEELLEQKLDTAVARGRRQAADAASCGVLNPLRQTLQPSRPAIGQERGIATEQLVTPVAAQDHGDAPSRLLRQPIQQQE